jgi:hypothetical protein
MRRSALARLALSAALVALACTAAGCSISHSVKSISDSISSPFRSSSDSSGGEDDPAYRDEVASFTSGYATAGGDAAAFRRGIAAIAEKRGVHDWQGDDATCRAIGVGLRKAGLTEDQAQAQAGRILDGDAGRVKEVMKGYGD